MKLPGHWVRSHRCNHTPLGFPHFVLDLVDEVIDDFWLVLVNRINDHYDQWLRDWEELKVKLDTKVARTKEAQDDFARGWKEEIEQHQEQAAKDRVAYDKEIARLTAS